MNASTLQGAEPKALAEDDRSFRTRLLTVVAGFTLLAAALTAVVDLAQGYARGAPLDTTRALLMLIAAVVLAALRLGRLQLATHLYLWLIFALMTFGIFLSGGTRAPLAAIYIFLILLAARMASFRAMLAMAAFCTIASVAVATLESAQLLPPTTFPQVPYRRALTNLLILAVTVILAFYIFRDNHRRIDELRRTSARLRELSRRLAQVEETERRSISRELHDRVGQNLGALTLTVGMIRARVGAALPPDAAARLDDAQRLLESTAARVRDLMADLRPAALDDYGLLAALRSHAGDFARRLGVPVSVQGRDIEPRLPSTTETALFRIAQEALSNIAKHAGAKAVDIALEESDGRVVLSVADDGAGFDPAAARAKNGWGMSIMRERAETVDAELRVHSAPGAGTRISVAVARGAA